MKHIVELDCRCVNQNGKEVIAGKAVVIAPTSKIKREKVQLPQVILKNPEGTWYHQLVKKIQNKKPLITAIVHPADEISLKGAILSAKDKIIEPLLIGPESKIREVAEKCNIDLAPFQIISTEHSQAAAEN